MDGKNHTQPQGRRWETDERFKKYIQTKIKNPKSNLFKIRIGSAASNHESISPLKKSAALQPLLGCHDEGNSIRDCKTKMEQLELGLNPHIGE